MHQPTPTIPPRGDRATFDQDYSFCAQGRCRKVYRVSAEDVSPDLHGAHPLVWCRNREATAAAEWLILIVALYRCERALA